MHLMEYLKHNKIKPFGDSAFLKELNIHKTYLGNIAKGIRRPSLAVAVKIESATGGAVSVSELLDYYNAVQSGEFSESSDLHEPLDPHDTPDPGTSPAEDAPAQASLFSGESHDSTVSVG